MLLFRLLVITISSDDDAMSRSLQMFMQARINLVSEYNMLVFDILVLRNRELYAKFARRTFRISTLGLVESETVSTQLEAKLLEVDGPEWEGKVLDITKYDINVLPLCIR